MRSFALTVGLYGIHEVVSLKPVTTSLVAESMVTVIFGDGGGGGGAIAQNSLVAPT